MPRSASQIQAELFRVEDERRQLSKVDMRASQERDVLMREFGEKTGLIELAKEKVTAARKQREAVQQKLNELDAAQGKRVMDMNTKLRREEDLKRELAEARRAEQTHVLDKPNYNKAVPATIPPYFQVGDRVEVTGPTLNGETFFRLKYGTVTSVGKGYVSVDVETVTHTPTGRVAKMSPLVTRTSFDPRNLKKVSVR